MRLGNTVWRAIRRYFLVFTAIALLPLALVYLVRNEQFYKIKGFDYINDSRPVLLPEETVQTLSPDDVSKVERNMERRRKFLYDKCSELGLDVIGNDSLHKPNTWEFLINRKYHLIWCNIFKAASSSWMYNFNILAGYSPEYLHKTKEIFLNLARDRYPRVSMEELLEAQNDSTTFLIARHPFERLLSAYRDKMVFAIPHSYHDKLGRSIVRKYRRKVKADQLTKAERTKYPSFPEFVRWFNDQVRLGRSIDMHFTSSTKFCSPCLINFDIILKFETLEEDQLYLIEKTGLKRVIAVEWRNMGKGKNTLELLQSYYSQLTSAEIQGLYEYYRYDFELFDYNADIYFELVRKKEEAAAAATATQINTTAGEKSLKD